MTPWSAPLSHRTDSWCPEPLECIFTAEDERQSPTVVGLIIEIH